MNMFLQNESISQYSLMFTSSPSGLQNFFMFLYVFLLFVGFFQSEN